MAKAYQGPLIKYMVIDTTSVEHTSVIKVAYIREAALWGRLYQAQGRKVTVRSVEGKSFSCLDKLQLQYLFWNVCQQTPPEDYAELVQTCLASINQIPVAETTVTALETELEALAPSGGYTGNKSTPKPPKDPNAPPDRPKATSTTGIVWIICDELYAAAGNQIPDRKVAIAKCEAEEINAATASTQYSKWKKAKLAESI